MPSSYSTNLKIELQATGENSGTWGTITNTNLGTALEQAVVGYGNPSYPSDANLTLTYTDTNAAQAARALVLNVTSAVSLSATRELVVPTIQKQYIVQNNTSGSQSITVKTSAGTGITVPNGRKAHLYVNGTDVIFMDDYVDINGGTIDGTTIGANSAAAGNFTTVDTTNIEVTNLKAKDGTTAGSIADATGVVTLGSSVLTTTDINGGTIDGTTIGGSSAAAGTFTTLTTSSTVTLNGGTANGVLFLNGSKVATSGSGLTYNGSTFGVAGTAKFGSGVASNSQTLMVNNPSGTATQIQLLQDGVESWTMGMPASSAGLAWAYSSVEQMRLTSTGLGIGTASPGTRLDVATSSGDCILRLGNGTSQARFAVDNDGPYIYPLTSGDLSLRVFTPAGGTAATIDSSGNLGLGVTPSAWWSGSKAMQLGQGASIEGRTSTNIATFGSNVFVNSAGSAAYINSAFAARYVLVDGTHVWQIAPSGTAGNTISFTQAMTLDASGNLGVGTSSPLSTLDVVVGAGGARRVLVNYDDSIITIKGASNTSSPETLRFVADNIRFNTGTTGSGTERGRFTAGGNFGVGLTDPNAPLEVQADSGGTGIRIRGRATANSGTLRFYANNGTTQQAKFEANDSVVEVGSITNVPLLFYANGSERARITSGGDFVVGKTTAVIGTAGGYVTALGEAVFTVSGNPVLYVNRLTDDGDLVRFYQAGTQEGSISVSGTTVSYNGGHLSRWSQTADNTRIPLLKGTVMSNLDQMAVWEKDGQPLPNEQLNCMKVSDVEGDVNVAGVFVNWDNDDEDFTNDMNIAMTGDMIIRIAQNVTVQRGDLLMSAGDGTAKPQGDDIIRSKTVAKVTSNHVTCTYEDGSYCVPCVLMAC